MSGWAKEEVHVFSLLMDARLKSSQPSPSSSPADATRSATHSSGQRCRRRPRFGSTELHGARLFSSVFLLPPSPTCRTDGRMSAGCGGGDTLRCKPLRQSERLSSSHCTIARAMVCGSR